MVCMRTKLTKPSARVTTPAVDPPMTRTNYFIPAAMKKGLARLAKREDTTAAELVRTAIGEHLKRNGIAA